MTPSTNVSDSNVQINGLPCLKSTSNNDNHQPTSLITSISAANEQGKPMPCLGDLKLIKKPEVLALVGLSKSTLHLHIASGLMPPPVPIGERAVAFVQHEIQAVLAAKIAGCSRDELKQLISELVNLRQEIYAREVLTCNM